MNAPTLLPGETIRLIQRLVAQRYKIPLETMSSASRRREFAHPRQIAMSLASEFTRKPNGVIGKRFGGRARKTVTYAIAAVKRRSAESRAERQDLAALRAQLKNLPILQK